MSSSSISNSEKSIDDGISLEMESEENRMQSNPSMRLQKVISNININNGSIYNNGAIQKVENMNGSHDVENNDEIDEEKLSFNKVQSVA